MEWSAEESWTNDQEVQASSTVKLSLQDHLSKCFLRLLEWFIIIIIYFIYLFIYLFTFLVLTGEQLSYLSHW